MVAGGLITADSGPAAYSLLRMREEAAEGR